MSDVLKILSIPSGTYEMEVPPNCSIIGVVPEYDDDNGGPVLKVFMVETVPEPESEPEPKPAPKKRAPRKRAPAKTNEPS